MSNPAGLRESVGNVFELRLILQHAQAGRTAVMAVTVMMARAVKERHEAIEATPNWWGMQHLRSIL
jgi:hypothetical protein